LNTTLLIARLLLASIFAVAGLAKLADLRGSRQAISDFGLPSALATPLGILLPLAELAVAGVLIPSSTALWGALGALVLLLVFVVGIGANLARGRKPDCHCFGQLHSAPVGWKTLARNGVLATVAGFLVWRGWEGEIGPSALSWLGALSTTQLFGLIGGLLVLALLGGQWWFLVHLLGQNGRLLVRVEALEANVASGAGVPSPNGVDHQTEEGLPVGSQAPAFSLSGLFGETLTLDALRAPDKPVMLLFTDPHCGPCSELLPQIGRWQEEHVNKLSIALISRGTADENRAKGEEHGLTNLLLQEDWEISQSYQVGGTPSAVLVRPDGTIGSPVAGGSEVIGSLVAQAVSDAPIQFPTRSAAPEAQGEPCPNCGKVHPDGNGAQQQAMPASVKVGQPAPEVKLPDLEGNEVSLQDFKGEQTLVLFWNPGCGFCQQMLPDLKEWEATSPKDAPKLVVVSAGTEEANKEIGLASPVLLDQQFAVGRAFGASGTPSAVLVDAEGKVASEVAVGAPAVMELAGAGKTKT
jgi:methylamine dehydrogenase accessory protein MauD